VVTDPKASYATSLDYAPAAVLLDPLPGVVRGPDAIRKYDESIRSAFPDARLTLSRPVVRGTQTAVEWEFGGTNEGPLVLPLGVVSATHRTVHLRGASFLRFTANGLVAEEHRYYDLCALLEQLGVR
jgi:predicted ester cyclase